MTEELPDANPEPRREPELEARFRELRAHDARRAPRFEQLARPPMRTWRWIAPLALAAAALTALFLVVRGRAPHEGPTAPVSPTLVPTTTYVAIEPAPLDFLLDSPQSDFLGRTPSFDVAPVQEPRK